MKDAGFRTTLISMIGTKYLKCRQSLTRSNYTTACLGGHTGDTRSSQRPEARFTWHSSSLLFPFPSLHHTRRSLQLLRHPSSILHPTPIHDRLHGSQGCHCPTLLDMWAATPDPHVSPPPSPSKPPPIAAGRLYPKPRFGSSVVPLVASCIEFHSG